jgi:long-chain acyl-CoA synthetase
MTRPWLAHYPAGVPADIDTSAFGSLVELMEASFSKFRDLPAYKFMGKTVTFGQVDDLSRAFAPGCRGRAWRAVTAWRS